MPRCIRAVVIFSLLSVAQGEGFAHLAQTAGGKRIGHNSLELLYVQMATRLAAAAGAKEGVYPVPDPLPVAIAVCDKIHPDAVYLSTAWGGDESWTYAYLHSICISHVAQWARAPELCNRIQSLAGPAPRPLPEARRTHFAPATCRQNTQGHGGPGYADFATELGALLLGYSRDQMIKVADGRLPEEEGAYEFMSKVLPTPSDEEDYYGKWEDHLKRYQRLPDFSRGDTHALTQLDRLYEGWTVRGNTTRLALALQCAVQRLEPGQRLSEECQGRM